MVTADYDADGAVRAVVGVTQGIILILVGSETKLIQTLLQTLMKWHEIGTKRNDFALAVNLKIEMLA